MEGPRNNLKIVKPRTDSGENSDAREGRTKAKAFKFNLGSPEKPKSIYPILPNDFNKPSTSGRSALPVAINAVQPNRLGKTLSLNLEKAIPRSNPTPPRPASVCLSPIRKATVPLKRPSPDTSSSQSKRVKRDTPLVESTRINLPVAAFRGLPSASSSTSRAPSPSKHASTSSTIRDAGASKSSSFDQMSIDKLLRLKSNRQEKALEHADVLMSRLKKNRDDDDLDFLEDQYAFLKKKVNEIEEAIARRKAPDTTLSSTSFSSITVLSPGDCYEVPTKLLFTSPTKYASETTWAAPPRSPVKEWVTLADTTLSSATTSNSPQLPSKQKDIEDEDLGLWEEVKELGHEDFQTQSPLPIAHKKSAIAPVEEFKDNLSFSKALNKQTLAPAPAPHNKYSDGPRYKEVLNVLRKVFKKEEFRTNQLEAIMGTLAGRDVFVLMPTGGGKSLCYQLPALCTTGTTHGVTIVISPLKALMEDQVQILKDLNIEAAHVNSDQENADTKQIYSRLRGNGRPISILYLSPEKLDSSAVMKDILASLHAQNRIARLVVDEAHVFVNWGRNFRGSYRGLCDLRTTFPNVPIMALTATATDLVIRDVSTQLQMKKDYVHLSQSFNRPNLTYTILRKSGGNKVMTKTMAEWIKSNHPRSTGIIYCLSKNDCDSVAEELDSNHGISARSFHSEVDKDTKREILHSWQAGRTLVIVATIAFGMGIDKPDVRFVIHHSLPKGLDGYYQETGRAGRDGKPSDCILYYAWKDVTRIDRMIQMEEDIQDEERQRQREDVRKVARYCMLDIDCRRQNVLQYFGEPFDRQQCKNGCDNCIAGKTGTLHDLTKEAIQIAQFVKDYESQKFTRIACIQVYRGGSARGKPWDRSPYRGKGSHWDQNTTERLFDQLSLEDIVQEYSEKNTAGYFTYYIKIGGAAQALLNGERKFEMEVSDQKETKSKTTSKGKTKIATVASVNRSTVEEISYFDDDGDDLGKPIEYYAHSKKDARPVASTSKVTITTRTTATISATTKSVAAESCDLEEGSFINELHQSLYELRAQIAESENVDEQDVLVDECLEMLALTEPRDPAAFEQHVSDAYGKGSKEMKRFMKKYGLIFLDVCVGGSSEEPRERSRKKANALTKAEMRSKFTFESTSVERGKGNKKAGIRGMDI